MKHIIKRTDDFCLSYEEIDVEGYKDLPAIHCDIYTAYTPRIKRELKETIDDFGSHWAISDEDNHKQNKFIQSFGYFPIEIMEDLAGVRSVLYHYGGVTHGED